MVRISPTGERRLADLREAKAAYDKALEAEETEHRYRKRQLREPIIAAVEAALIEGVPRRQVALKGLGFADVGSLKSYERTEQPRMPYDPSTSGAYLPVSAPVVPKQPVTILTPFMDGTVELLDGNGELVEVYGFWGGTEDNPTIFTEYEIDKRPDFEEIKAVLAEAYPNAEWE